MCVYIYIERERENRERERERERERGRERERDRDVFHQLHLPPSSTEQVVLKPEDFSFPGPCRR